MVPERGARPQDLVATACELFGRERVIDWCAHLLSGRAGDADAQWPDISWLGGTIGWPDYWPRVWGARGLLHAGEPHDPRVVLDALGDPHWRVREMVLKVIRAHDIPDPRGLIDRVTDDPVARVRRQAWRTLGVPGPPQERRPAE